MNVTWPKGLDFYAEQSRLKQSEVDSPTNLTKNIILASSWSGTPARTPGWSRFSTLDLLSHGSHGTSVRAPNLRSALKQVQRSRRKQRLGEDSASSAWIAGAAGSTTWHRFAGPKSNPPKRDGKQMLFCRRRTPSPTTFDAPSLRHPVVSVGLRLAPGTWSRSRRRRAAGGSITTSLQPLCSTQSTSSRSASHGFTGVRLKRRTRQDSHHQTVGLWMGWLLGKRNKKGTIPVSSVFLCFAKT